MDVSSLRFGAKPERANKAATALAAAALVLTPLTNSHADIVCRPAQIVAGLIHEEPLPPEASASPPPVRIVRTGEGDSLSLTALQALPTDENARPLSLGHSNLLEGLTGDFGIALHSDHLGQVARRMGLSPQQAGNALRKAALEAPKVLINVVDGPNKYGDIGAIAERHVYQGVIRVGDPDNGSNLPVTIVQKRDYLADLIDEGEGKPVVSSFTLQAGNHDNAQATGGFEGLTPGQETRNPNTTFRLVELQNKPPRFVFDRNNPGIGKTVATVTVCLPDDPNSGDGKPPANAPTGQPPGLKAR